MKQVKTLFIIVLLTCISSMIYAKNYYVAVNGSGSGTSSSPYGTIAQAAKQASAGDTIFIKGGSYSEMSIKPTNSGSQAKGCIVFCNWPNTGRVVLKKKNNVSSDKSNSIFDISNKSYIWLQGLNFEGMTYVKSCINMANSSNCVVTACKFKNIGTEAVADAWDGSAMIWMNNSKYCTVSNSYFNNIIGDGISYVGSNTKGNLLCGNTFVNLKGKKRGWATDGGKFSSGITGQDNTYGDNLMCFNYFSGGSNGVWLDRDGSTSVLVRNFGNGGSLLIFNESRCSRNWIQENVAINMSDAGFRSASYGGTNPSYDSRYINNVVYNSKFGIYLHKSHHNEVRNNIVYNSSNYNLVMTDSACFHGENYFRNNFWRSTSKTSSIQYKGKAVTPSSFASSVGETGGIYTNTPDFVSTGSSPANYMLKSSSQCIKAGDGGIDMGAYPLYSYSDMGCDTLRKSDLVQPYFENVITEVKRGQSYSVTIRLMKSVTKAATVKIIPVAGDAKQNTDFTLSSSSVTFQPGETSKTITISFMGVDSEFNKLLLLRLCNSNSVPYDAKGYAAFKLITSQTGHVYSVSQIVAGAKHDVSLSGIDFCSWSGIGANSVSTGVLENNYGGGASVEGGTLLYGDGDVNNLKYANLTGCTKLTINGTDGVVIRALFNRQTASGSDYIEKSGTITDGKYEINLSDVSSSYVHLNAIKTGWGSASGSINSIYVTDPNSPIDYSLSGSGSLSSSALKALSDLTAKNIDATGLTNDEAIMLNVANKNCLIYVDKASRLLNTQNVVVKEGDNYTCSNLVLTDFAGTYKETATAWLAGGSVTGSNASWQANDNGGYTYSWNVSSSSVEIFHNLVGKETYNKLNIETSEFTAPWGVRFYDSDGQSITSQGYWAGQTSNNLTKVIDIDSLFTANEVSSRRGDIKSVSIYNINASDNGKMTLKNMYLTKEISNATAWLSGGSVSGNNATWTESVNGGYSFTWTGTNNSVEIFHNILGKTQYSTLVVETSEFTSPWGVRFYDSDGTLIAEQGYWNGQNANNLIKEINIDSLLAAKDVSGMRTSLKTISLYSIGENGKVTVKNMYLTEYRKGQYYSFYSPYNITATNATCYLTVDTFSPAWVPFNANVPGEFDAYVLNNAGGTVTVNPTSSMSANRPVLLSGNGVAVVRSSNVTVNATDNLVNGSFVGVYDRTKLESGSYSFVKINDVDGISFTEVTSNDTQYAYPLHAYVSKNIDPSIVKSISKLVAGEDPNENEEAMVINNKYSEMSEIHNIYDITGSKVNKLQKGIKIIRMTDGATKKVLVR